MNTQIIEERDLSQRVTMLLEKAVDHHKQGKLAEAVQLYQEVIKLDDNLPTWVYGNLITLLTELGSIDQAIALGNQIKKHYKEADDVLRAFALALEKQENLSSSVIYYQQAINVNPEQPDWVYSRLANILILQNSVEEAIKVSQQGIELYPDSYWVNYYLGIAFEKKSNLEQAKEFKSHAQQLKSSSKIEAIEAVNSQADPNQETSEPPKSATVTKAQDAKKIKINSRKSSLDSPQELDIKLKKNMTYPQIAKMIKYEPKISIEDKISTKDINFLDDDILELTKPQIENQIKLIKEKLNKDYQDQLFDGLLYELARTQLFVKSLNFQLKILSNRLIIKDSILPGLSINNQNKSVEIDAEFPLCLSQGFYALEYDNQGIPFRWTGSEKFFYFDVFLDREQQSELTLILANTIVPEIIGNLRCFIDGVEILINYFKQDNMFYVQGTVPAINTNDITRISFLMPKLAKVSDLNPSSQDNRTLGVAFHKLKINKGLENNN